MHQPITGEHYVSFQRARRKQQLTRHTIENILFMVVLVLVAASGVRHARQSNRARCEEPTLRR